MVLKPVNDVSVHKNVRFSVRETGHFYWSIQWNRADVTTVSVYVL